MTNREKLAELRRQALAGAETCGVQSNEGRINASFRIMSELLGLLLGADGPRSPLADAERADKLTLARDHVTAARSLMEPKTEAGVVGQALSAIAILTDVLAAEPTPRRSPAADLQPGDVVQLRSGGPAMTVEPGAVASQAGDMLCSWFKDGLPASRSFHPAALVRVADEQKAAQRERERRSILVDAARALNDVRQTIEGRPLAALQAAEIAERIVALRDRITAALVEDA